jgi:AcrR family transcriptional regulator
MSNEKKRLYHHQNLREKLLGTATEMIAERDAGSVTMRALARRIGVSRSAPYRHFPDKAALLAAVAEEGFNHLGQCLREASQDEQQDPLVRLQNMVHAYIQFAIDHPTRYRLMFGKETSNREAYPSLKAAEDKSCEDLQILIELCQREKKMIPGDPYLQSNAIWAIWHGVASLIIDRQLDDAEIPSLITMTLQIMMEGLKI